MYITNILVISPISIPLTHSLSPSLPIHVFITVICKHINTYTHFRKYIKSFTRYIAHNHPTPYHSLHRPHSLHLTTTPNH